MAKLKVFMVILCGGLSLVCQAQTPLARAFAGLKSNDPKIVEATKQSLLGLVDQEFPNIERDGPLLCMSLHDQDAYIRLQSAALLAVEKGDSLNCVNKIK